MEMAKAENVSQSDNIFNTIDSIQQKNHVLKSLLQEKGKLYENDEEGIKQNLDTVLFLSKQVSIELLEKFRSAKDILQTTSEIVTALCEQNQANTNHRGSFTEGPGEVDLSLGIRILTPGSRQPREPMLSQVVLAEQAAGRLPVLCTKTEKSPGCSSPAINIIVVTICHQGPGVKNQPGIQKPDETDEHLKNQHRVIKEMDCSTEVKDTDKTLKSGSVGNKGGGKEIHLTAVSETAGADEKRTNKLNDKNKITESPAEAVKTEDPRGWSQRVLLAELDDGDDPQIGCYVTAPFITAQKLLCRIINDRSAMVVSDGEELVSNVISIRCADSRIKIPFPVRIAIPFTARYQGNYRDIMVKVSDGTTHSSYMSPISLEGMFEGHKGSCAEVKIYKLGIFSVVSCLRKETFTVPRKGLALKLSMDSRITLNYLPGSFTAPVVVQSKVQPIETTLLCGIKSRQDIYHPIISTSPLVHIKHPSTQQFRKSIAVTLPCPPNSDKKRLGDETDHVRAATAMGQRSSSHRIRSMSAPVKKHGETINESLKLLGFKSKDEGWLMMDNVTVKDVQNGLVAFEYAEHLDRFIVLRLSSSVDSSYLIPFIHELEEAIRFTMVNVIMYHKRDNFHHIIVQMVPSKDLQWEVVKLREEGYRGPPEPSEEFPMREGEQLMLKLCGNIKSFSSEQGTVQGYQLIFHSQRKTRLELDLTEVDEFGNYCSPHYKGMAIFYKITKEELTKQWDGAYHTVDDQQYSPVCKLSLTLPKHRKLICRFCCTLKVMSHEKCHKETASENVLYWVASELSEEDAALLVTSLRIRRSAIQLVRLTNPDDLTDQIFKLLNMWKKNLPTSADKIQILSRHLKRCGREDLAEELWSKSESG
ncbi:death domain-containing protein 1 [Heptranchias perlo]|uniref:death domain-containing protein 1 n=1 Tax=Heptranchias perlo TaxID=212740 RepID=UPI00355A1F78